MSAPQAKTTYPNWLSGSAITHMNGILRDLQRDAGITEVVKVQYLHEQDILKRELPASSVLFVPSSPLTTPFRLCCVVTGEDARNEKARVTMGMSTFAAAKLKAFLALRPQGVYQATIQKPAPKIEPTPAAPHIQALDTVVTSDAEARAIFLADVRAHGRQITRATAESCTGGKEPAMIEDCVKRGLLSESGPILSLTADGDAFLAACFDAPAEQPEPAQGMHEFDRLKAAVRQARLNHAAIQAEHGKNATARALLARELDAARKELKAAEDSQKSLQQRIEEAQAKAVQSRGKVLQLESQQRNLPDESKLAAAQRELEAAEKAFRAFTTFD